MGRLTRFLDVVAPQKDDIDDLNDDNDNENIEDGWQDDDDNDAVDGKMTMLKIF